MVVLLLGAIYPGMGAAVAPVCPLLLDDALGVVVLRDADAADRSFSGRAVGSLRAGHRAERGQLAVLSDDVLGVDKGRQRAGGQPATASMRGRGRRHRVQLVSGLPWRVSADGYQAVWGRAFSSDSGVVEGVKRIMVFVGAMEVVKFPMAVSGGVLRGTAKPTWAVYADNGGFYFMGLPVGVVLAFKVGLGLVGLLLGFLIGVGACFLFLVTLMLRLDWVAQAGRAQDLAGVREKDEGSYCKFHI